MDHCFIVSLKNLNLKNVVLALADRHVFLRDKQRYLENVPDIDNMADKQDTLQANNPLSKKLTKILETRFDNDKVSLSDVVFAISFLAGMTSEHRVSYYRSPNPIPRVAHGGALS